MFVKSTDDDDLDWNASIVGGVVLPVRLTVHLVPLCRHETTWAVEEAFWKRPTI